MGSVTSIKDGRRYIPVHDFCSSLSSITCDILPAVHALTGCDTIAIFGIGKQSVFKLIKSSSAELSDLSELKDPDLESSICVTRKVVAKLYDPKAKYNSCHTNLNKLRVRLATSKDCSPAFKQHVLRASIQATMWVTSHQAKPPVASPYDYGWQKGSNGPTQFVLWSDVIRLPSRFDLFVLR
jgi:hypothetical protein